MAIYDVTSYGAKSNYNPAGGTPPTWNTDNTTAFKDAINAAKAAGGGTIYIPGGGTGYLLNSRYDSTGHPNQILPTLDVGGVRIIGDQVGMGGSLIIVNQDYDVFRVGIGDGTGGWAGGSVAPEGFEISGLTIQAAKGFYGSSGIVFHVFNALSADIHHFAIYDYGFAYGTDPNGNGTVFAIDPNTGFPYGKLPRPGVTTDPRGAGYQSADMGYLWVGAKMHGSNVYKNTIHDGQVNGCGGSGLEIGVYNAHADYPQGCSYKNMISARCWGDGCVQFNGDGSNGWTDVYSFQHKGNAFLYLPPSQAHPQGAPFSWGLTRCGADYIGGHGFYVWDPTGGGQTVEVSMDGIYAAGAGASACVYANWQSSPQAKKGILFQNGKVRAFEIIRARCIVNGDDGAEVCATVGPCKVWDSFFGYNGQSYYPNAGSSGLYVNNNTIGLNCQRNTFQGGTFTSFPNQQAWGYYSNNTNLTVLIFHGNVAQNNRTGQYNHGVTPTVNADNV